MDYEHYKIFVLIQRENLNFGNVLIIIERIDLRHILLGIVANTYK